MTRSRFGHIQYLGPDKRRIYWREDGRTRTKTVHGDDDAAEMELARVRLGESPVGDMQWQRYWTEAVEPTFEGLAAKTVSDYRRVWNRELAPRIGRMNVGSTGWRTVERVIGYVESPSVQRHVFRLWRKMCNLAVRDGLLDRNPVDRSIRMRPQRKRAKTLLGASEVVPLLDAVEGTLFERLVLMEMCAGMRHEEAVAMTAEDVRYEDGRAILSVSKAVLYVDGVLVRKETKTAFSDRETALSGHLAQRLAACRWPARTQLPTTVTHNWREWCRAHGVEYVRFGDMRSNFATLACECCDSSLVSLVMGHGDGTTRGRHYQRSTRRCAEMVADAFADYVSRG